MCAKCSALINRLTIECLLVPKFQSKKSHRLTARTHPSKQCTSQVFFTSHKLTSTINCNLNRKLQTNNADGSVFHLCLFQFRFIYCNKYTRIQKYHIHEHEYICRGEYVSDMRCVGIYNTHSICVSQQQQQPQQQKQQSRMCHVAVRVFCPEKRFFLMRLCAEIET